MNKRSYILLAICIVILWLIGYLFIQLNNVSEAKKTLVKEIEDLEVQIHSYKKEQIALSTSVQSKDNEIEILNNNLSQKEGTIRILTNRKSALEKDLSNSKKLLSLARQAIRNKGGEASLQSMIENLESQNQSFRDQINGLNADIDSIRQENQRYIVQKDSILTISISLKQSLDSITFISDSLNLVIHNNARENLVMNTLTRNISINCSKIRICEKPECRNDIDKLKKRNRDKWKYTTAYIQPELSPSFPDSLLGDLGRMDFLLGMRLIDKDANQFVELREKNQKEDKTGSYLVKFDFDNEQARSVEHENYQEKLSDNYDLQFVILYKNEEYPISSGNYSLFIDGKNIAID